MHIMDSSYSLYLALGVKVNMRSNGSMQTKQWLEINQPMCVPIHHHHIEQDWDTPIT